ncbi:hypothetical protein ACFQBQ_07750 [Granulicella cerasi]|uniref:Helix-turn-helix type 11 domain-containing protein n=1 Tax=Granulicella cerasi TaxID=741063 RepID=A0ABW1Z7Z9_9BACT|nr:hypothetical protein [Granulicella cerasi]
MTDTLFAFSEHILDRVEDIFAGREVARPLTDEEGYVLVVLRLHVGKANSIARADLCEQTGIADRTVRAIVSDLRLQFALPIGSNRENGGYYLPETLAEVSELTEPMVRQALSLLRSVRSLRGRSATAELLGQVRIELQSSEEEEQ